MIEKFIDYVELSLISGHGGAGAISFRREKFIPHGGPDGGDGGQGGSIIIRVNPQLSNFSHLKGKRTFKAQNGLPGMGNRKHGKDGENLILEVPLGTELKTKKRITLHDFGDAPGEYLFLKGGKGGLGNYHFKSAVKQKPDYAQKGLPGKAAEVILEIKLIADIGLVGFPNAGKSTLLSVLTRANPKIASYPFTTLTPNLGVYHFTEGSPTENSLIIADIPGLTENSHLGQGLGIQFLRHIERTGELFFLLDSFSDDPYRDFTQLQKELRSYSEKLYQKKFHILITKMDLINSPQEEEKLEQKLASFPDPCHEVMLKISSLNQIGFEELRQVLSVVWKRKNIDEMGG